MSNKMNNHLKIALPDNLFNQLKEIAAEHNMPVSTFARFLLSKQCSVVSENKTLSDYCPFFTALPVKTQAVAVWDTEFMLSSLSKTQDFSDIATDFHKAVVSFSELPVKEKIDSFKSLDTSNLLEAG